MAEILTDINNLVNIQALPPASYATITPAVIDMGANAHVSLNAIMSVGAITGSPGAVAVKLQESANAAGPFVDIPNGAFAAPTAANTTVTLMTLRHYRYVQVVGTLPGATFLSVQLLSQPKEGTDAATLPGFHRSPATPIGTP